MKKHIALNLILLVAFFNSAVSQGTATDYYNRGNAKEDLKDYNGACKDGRKAKELGDFRADGLIKTVCY